ncbi:hypothetical protein BDZ91DRAFT_494598 [Kalaharituber pfeilii]|nr:hypothetical protein BDZ91DRAFT_494598 [Kalaharituber pfeilii]
MPGDSAAIGEDAEESSSQGSDGKSSQRKRSRGGVDITASQQQEASEPVEQPVEETKRHRKKSRGSSYKSGQEIQAQQKKTEDVVMEDTALHSGGDDDDGSQKLVAEHNKLTSQRLQERILQLGKLNAAKSFPATTTTTAAASQDLQTQSQPSAGPMYPDLAQAKEGGKNLFAPQEKPQEQASRSVREQSATDDDWIPPVRSQSTRQPYTKSANSSAKNSLTRSQTMSAGVSRSQPTAREIFFEDAARPRNSRGESPGIVASGKPNLPQSLSFNAINSPFHVGASASASSSQPVFPTPSTSLRDTLPHSPKPTSKKSYGSIRNEPEQSPEKPTQPSAESGDVSSYTANAFRRAKEMFIKTTIHSSPGGEGTAAGRSSSQKGHRSSPSVVAAEREQSPMTPQVRQGTPKMYPDLGSRIEEEGDTTEVKLKRQTRGSRSKEMLQRQQEEARLREEQVQMEEEERRQQALVEERERQEERARLEEKRRQAEARRKEKEQQRKLAEQKRMEEEARLQREREEREEEMRRHKEELRRKEEELQRLKEEQRLQMLRREEELRLRQEQEEELRRQELERRRREEEEERARKEAEEKEARRIAEEEERRAAAAAEEETRRQAEEARIEELRRRQEEDIRRQQEAAEKRRVRETTPVAPPADSEDEGENSQAAGGTSASRIARPKSAMNGRPPSRLQPPSTGKRPQRPQPPQKGQKPAPVSIQVGTASQRAAMDRHKPGAPPPSATLISAMKDSFNSSAATAGKERPPSTEPTLMQSSSAPNLKKVAASITVTASASTSNLKKVQMDEKKREESRRMIEARREEIRRKEAAAEEERRRVAAAAGQGRRTVERDMEPPKKTFGKTTIKGLPPSAKMTRVAANANVSFTPSCSVFCIFFLAIIS